MALRKRPEGGWGYEMGRLSNGHPVVVDRLLFEATQENPVQRMGLLKRAEELWGPSQPTDR